MLRFPAYLVHLVNDRTTLTDQAFLGWALSDHLNWLLIPHCLQPSSIWPFIYFTPQFVTEMYIY